MNKIPFFALLTANIVSVVGNVLAMIALPWFVFTTTHSATQTGVSGFFEAVPIVLSAFFGGAIIDRFGGKRSSVVADSLSGIMVAAIPFLFTTVGLAFWQLLALIFLTSLFDTSGNTARRAFLPDVVQQANIKLERANATYQGIQRLATLVGAPLAGALIAAFGATTVLWIDAATFFVSAIVIALLVAVPRGAPVASSTHYWEQIGEGLTYIRHDRLMLTFVTTFAVTNFVDVAFTGVVLPVYANRTFGNAVSLGAMFASFGAGAVLGTALFGVVGPRLPRRATMVTALFLLGVPYWVLAAFPSLGIAMAVLVFGGVASGPLNPLILTISQERIPAELRGRVFGVITAGASAIAPLGVLLSGFLIDGVGLVVTLLFFATLYLIIGVRLFFAAELHTMPAPVIVERT